jgi:hypothetical protein
VDGAAGPDGTIYLLAERQTSDVPSFCLLTRLPGEDAWRKSPGFNSLACQGPGGILVHNSARLAVDADSEVVLYASDRRRDGGLTIAVRERLLADSLWRTHPVGIALPGGARLSSGRQGHWIAPAVGAAIMLPMRHASLIGVDDAGTSFALWMPDGSPTVAIEAYDRGGRLLARRQIPHHRTSEWSFYGRGQRFVTPDGRQLDLDFGSDALRIVAWSVVPRGTRGPTGAPGSR